MTDAEMADLENDTVEAQMCGEYNIAPRRSKIVYSSEMAARARQKGSRDMTDRALDSIDGLGPLVDAAAADIESSVDSGDFARNVGVGIMWLLKRRLGKARRECLAGIKEAVSGIDFDYEYTGDAAPDRDGPPLGALSRAGNGAARGEPGAATVRAFEAVEDLWNHVAVAALAIELSVVDGDCAQDDALAMADSLDERLEEVGDACVERIKATMDTLISERKKSSR